MKPPRAPKPSTLLLRALRLFDDGKRWTKSVLKRKPSIRYPKGAFCSIGAIYEINTPNQQAAMTYLYRAINESAGFGTITGYNDFEETGRPDIKKVFLLAIKIARKEHQ